MTVSRYGEQAVTAFVMFCDENGLTANQRERLAHTIFEECVASVDTTVALFPELEDRDD